MKKLLSLMCSLLMIVTLCGCSSIQDQQEEVTLTLAAAASLENTFEDKLIPEFEKENPNIKVQGVYDSSGKLQIQIEQGLRQMFSFLQQQNKWMLLLMKNTSIKRMLLIY